jgi:hypothetical protein
MEKEIIEQLEAEVASLKATVRKLEAELAKRPTRKLTMQERYDIAMDRLVKHHELPTGQDS